MWLVSFEILGNAGGRRVVVYKEFMGNEGGGRVYS